MRRLIALWAVPLLLASVTATASDHSLPAPRRPLGAGTAWRLRPSTATLTVREPRLALQPVSPRELTTVLAGPTADAASVAVAAAPERGHAGAVSIQRRLDGVWTLQVPVSGQDAIGEAVDVQAEVMAASGSPNRLAPQVAGEPEIEVRVVTLPPRLVSRQADTVTYEGDLLLELDLSRIRISGTYSGTLVLTVNHF